MNIDLTPLFQALIAVLAALVTAKLIPWIKSKTTENQYFLFVSAVEYGVKAAEQLLGTGKGKEKMAYVVNYLYEQGFKVDQTVIEAAVHDLFPKFHTDIE